VAQEVNDLPLRIYGASDFRVPPPEERRTLLLAPGDTKAVPFKTVSNDPTGQTGAESLTSQPWFIPALLLAGVSLVTILSRRS
jgi:hypothetical protein